MNIFIYGGCVSRDTFNYLEANEYSIVHYYARSHLQSALHELSAIDNWSQNLASNFQKRMVAADFSKSIIHDLANSNYDLILLDFNTERHSMFIFEDGSRCTISSELSSAGFKAREEKGRIIKPFSDEMYSLWELAWKKFISLMEKLNAKDKVIINAVTWTKITSDNLFFDGIYTEAYLDSANRYLQKIYQRISIDIPSEQFIAVPEELNIASVDHRWGKSPFHYIDDYYIHLASEIKKRFSLLKIKGLIDSSEFSFNVSDNDVRFSLSISDLSAKDLYFSYYLMINNKKTLDSGYKKDRDISFIYDINEDDDVDIIYYIKDAYGQRVRKRLPLKKKKDQLVKIDHYLADFKINVAQKYIKNEYLNLQYDFIDDVLVISLPYTNDKVKIDKFHGIKWTEHDYRFNESSSMWFHSLYYVGFLIKESEKNELLDAYIHSAMNSFLSSQVCCDDKLKNISSADHSASGRILALINYATKYTSVLERNKIESIVGAIHFWVEWLASYKGYQNNNHGVMADIAVINGYLFLKSIPDAKEFENIAVSRLNRTISIAYDKDGFCNENTIGYHAFNNTLYSQVINMFLKESSSFSEANLKKINAMNEIIVSSERALKYAIWQDGSIPPIGDSPIIGTKLESINKSFCFFDSGFAVIKTDDIYFSLLCNSRTCVHKHVDDTSITLRYKNQEIIIDSGSYKYDKTDPHRASLVSSYSHSGFFTSTIDKATRIDYFKKLKPTAKIVEFLEENDSYYIKCENTIGDNAEILTREIFISLPLTIKIVDSFSITNERTVEYASQRFIFDETASILNDVNHGGFLLTIKDINFNIDTSANEHLIYKGEKVPTYRGWRSKENGEIIEALGMDLYIKNVNAGTITTKISLLQDSSLSGKSKG
ncbi:DUF6270 domain-containing protein [Aeromonas hydrophila]|uniref:DUF6270 domain-containing protein n=1 Tax=Aeromonas hydrophila TaxID=644 RepID=UPI0038CFC35F